MFSLYNMCLNIAGKCATAITRRYSQMSIEVRTFVSFLKKQGRDGGKQMRSMAL